MKHQKFNNMSVRFPYQLNTYYKQNLPSSGLWLNFNFKKRTTESAKRLYNAISAVMASTKITMNCSLSQGILFEDNLLSQSTTHTKSTE